MDIAEAKAKALLRSHEGFRARPYRCPAGKLTIGYGYNLDDRPFSMAAGEFLLEECVKEAVTDLESFAFWSKLDDDRKAALIDLRFNLGPGGFRSFKRFLAAMEVGDYALAARELVDSKWYRQVGRRGPVIVGLIRSGK